MNLLKKDATVSHTIYPNDNRAIYLNDNPISDQVVIGLAKHLKSSRRIGLPHIPPSKNRT